MGTIERLFFPHLEQFLAKWDFLAQSFCQVAPILAVMAHDELKTPSIDWDMQWQRHGRWIRTVLLARLPNRDCVEDVFQEMAVAIACNPASWPETEKIEPWLYRVAIRQVLMFRRRNWRRSNIGIEPIENIELEFEDHNVVDPSHWAINSEAISQLEKALEKIAARDREILLLKHSQDWTYQQIAQHLGITIDKVIYRIKRARKKLACLLNEVCSEWSEK